MKQRIAAVICTALIAASAPARAGSTADTLRALDQCASLADEHQRLGCYDQLGPEVKAALARIPGANAGPPTAQEQKNWFGFDLGGLFGSSPAQQTTPDKFGSEALPARATAPGEAAPLEPIDSITAKVTDFSFTPFGKFIVFLDNGQVWRQVEGDADKAEFDREDNVVAISRTMLGSYSMTINKSAKTFKVKRVK